MKAKLPSDPNIIAEMYARMDQGKIAAQFNICRRTVERYMRMHGLKAIRGPRNKTWPNTLEFKALLNQLYWFEGLSVNGVVKRIGLPRHTVMRAMKMLGIPRRAKSKRRYEQCAIPGCENMPCQVKKSHRGRVRWFNRKYCLQHHRELERARERNYKLRLGLRKTTRGPYKTKRKTWRMMREL